MSFLDEENSVSNPTEDKYLKFADPEQGKTVEVKVRILDAKPAKVFRHWIGATPQTQRPYNCPSRTAGCLACKERQDMRDRGEDPKATHRMDKRFLVNVLVLGGPNGPETKIWSFGQKIGEKLDYINERLTKEKAELRDVDITVIKRKTGPLKFNVEYDAIQEDKRKLTDAEKSAAEKRYNLEEEVKPAELDAIANAVRGIGSSDSGAVNGAASSAQLIELVDLAKKKDFSLEDLGVYDRNKLTAVRATELITALKS